MKKEVVLFSIVAISALIAINNHRFFSIEETGIFLTVIGLIYGLISAFLISNSWEKFTKLRDSISEEVSSLKSLYIYSKYLTDKKAVKNIGELIIAYCDEVPKVEWSEYKESKQTHKKFDTIVNIVAAIKIKTTKDAQIFAEISEELREAISARNMQLVLAETRISAMQWLLNIFLSTILIIGLAFVSIPNYTLSAFIVGSMVCAILLLLYVIHDIDSLKVSDYEVYIAPYQDLVEAIKEDALVEKKINE